MMYFPDKQSITDPTDTLTLLFFASIKIFRSQITSVFEKSLDYEIELTEDILFGKTHEVKVIEKKITKILLIKFLY